MARKPFSEPPPSHVIDLPRRESRAPKRPWGGFWRLFFLVRLGVLLTVLAAVSLLAVQDFTGRAARLEWRRPLEVAIVLVQQGELSPAGVRAFRSRLPRLEQELAGEFLRYRHADTPPFRFYVYGPVKAPPPPTPVASSSWLDQFADGVGRRVYAERLNRLANTPLLGFDSRVYVSVTEPGRTSPLRFVEGFSEQGGRYGFVSVQLDPTMVDYALFVVVHELFHTLGATDKYDSVGRTVVPSGLVDPARVPLYPQPRADVMAHGRPVSEVRDEPPADLSELGVGPATARELRWLVSRP